MADIVNGLFGLSPFQTRQQQFQQANQAGYNFAQLEPMQQAMQMAYSAGSGFGGLGAKMLGGVNVAEQEAARKEDLLRQVDYRSYEGLMAGAKLAQDRGDAQTAAQLVQLALQMREKDAYAKQVDKQGQKEKYATKDLAVPGKPGWWQTWRLDDQMNPIQPIGAEFQKGGKGASSAVSGANKMLEAKLKGLEQAIANTIGVQVGELRAALANSQARQKAANRVSNGTGWPEGNAPAVGAIANSVRKNLQDVDNIAQTSSLADMKAAGVSPGQMTEREWPKFSSDWMVPDKTLEPDEILMKFDQMLAKVDAIRAAMNQDESGGEQPQQPMQQQSTVPNATPNSVPDATPSVGIGAYQDAEKEARYQAWKASQGK